MAFVSNEFRSDGQRANLEFHGAPGSTHTSTYTTTARTSADRITQHVPAALVGAVEVDARSPAGSGSWTRIDQGGPGLTLAAGEGDAVEVEIRVRYLARAGKENLRARGSFRVNSIGGWA